MRPNGKYVLMLMLLTAVPPLFSQTTLNDPKDSVILRPLFLMESDVTDAMPMIESDISEYGFTQYTNGVKLPVSKQNEKRMYVIRGSFSLNDRLRDTVLSLYVAPTNYPYDVFLNGALLHKAGRYAGEYNSTVFTAYNILLPGSLLRFGEGKNEIAIKIVTWYGENTPLEALTLASYDSNSGRVFWRNLVYTHLLQGVSFLTLIISLYFSFLFVLGGFKDRKYVYFILLCLTFFMGCYNISFFHDATSEMINEKISKSGFPLAVMFLTFFIMELTETLNKKIYIKILLGAIAVVSTLTVVLAKDKIELNAAFNAVANMFIMVLLLINLVILFVAIIKKKQKSAILVLVAFLAIVGTSAHDIYYINTTLDPYTWMSSYGFCFMVISLFVLMAQEQIKTSRESVRQSETLKEVNTVQTKIITNVENVSSNLAASATQLDRIIAQSIDVIGNYGNDNRKITEKAIKEFDGLDATINALKNRINDFSDRISSSIHNQTSIVEEFTATFTNQTAHLENVISSVTESAKIADNLAVIANTSSNVVVQSKKSIEKLSDYSIFLNNVLTVLEDVVDRTNLLSINAAIEAARAGQVGKGFNVLALEIRKLASQSKENLESSFNKIKDMYTIIGENKNLSDDVSQSLYTIIDESNESARKVNAISELIREQQKEFQALLSAVESLLKDTLMIKDVSDHERKENENINITLTGIKDTFYAITQMLKGQGEREKELYSHLEQLTSVMNANLTNVSILKESVANK